MATDINTMQDVSKAIHMVNKTIFNIYKDQGFRSKLNIEFPYYLKDTIRDLLMREFCNANIDNWIDEGIWPRFNNCRFTFNNNDYIAISRPEEDDDLNRQSRVTRWRLDMPQ